MKRKHEDTLYVDEVCLADCPECGHTAIYVEHAWLYRASNDELAERLREALKDCAEANGRPIKANTLA